MKNSFKQQLYKKVGVIVGNKKPTGQANKGELGWVASIVLIEKLAFPSMCFY